MSVDLESARSEGAAGRPRMGFFTDSSICIGCKACEVACKEWNQVPSRGADAPGDGARRGDRARAAAGGGDFDLRRWTGNSYDNTMSLGADAWRHVAFIEQPTGDGGVRWLMNSDVCKHCTSAACLDVCPTGALFRTEFGTVVVQEDVCNGCGYCVPACPFGVIDRRQDDGRVFKCTLCYDRLKVGMEPACAQACPTRSIQYGELADLRARAAKRVQTLHEQGHPEARLYLEDDRDGIGGGGSFFLLMDVPGAYRLPADPVSTTRDLKEMWGFAAAAAGALAIGVLAAFSGGRR
ncbi:MAG: 4Fe-4S dicluster domain-containing protein [Candidatus Dormibacteraceae bacterium]